MYRFEDLDVWKRSARLTSIIFKYFKSLKDNGFKDQVTRSALSIPSNIAEGYERASNKYTVRFLYYSKGSCAELRTQLYIGIDIGYVDKVAGSKWIEETEELSKMLQGLIKSLKSF